MTLHPTLEAAARGDLPEWAQASPRRIAHMERVSDLLAEWAAEAEMAPDGRLRWRAMGHLHDACKDVAPEELRRWLGEECRDIPDPVLHGPAAARRLQEEGVEDAGLLHAVAWHTLGHPELGPDGMALYAADFLEPGRTLRDAWRAGLRERMPGELEAVTREILRARIEHLLHRNRPVHGLTMAFWNRMARGGQRTARGEGRGRWAPA